MAAIVVSRWEDRAKRGWQTEQRFLPPFAELLNGRRRLAPPKALEPQARFRPSPQPDPRVADAATAFSEPVQVLLSQADPQQTLTHNRLLSWLSAAGKGRWETFLHVCRCLGLGRDGREAGRIMRRLVLLGHVELSEKGNHWSVVPPTLMPIADEPERTFLRGQRTPSLLAHLPVVREEMNQPDGAAPSRVSFVPQPSEDAKTFSVGRSSFRLEHGGASKRAEAMPTWREWFDRTPAIHGMVLTKFARKERLDGTRWIDVTGSLFEEENNRIRGETGMYRLSREHPFRSTVYVFFDALGQKFVRGDWYGLAFLARHFQSLPLTARWSAEQQLFCIPSAERWPLVYEQVLVQASGLLPSRTSAGELCYSHVPKLLARCLCQKVAIDLIPLPHPEPTCPLLVAVH